MRALLCFKAKKAADNPFDNLVIGKSKEAVKVN